MLFCFQVSLFKFLRQSGDLLPPLLFIPYLKMLAALSTGSQSARMAFEMIRMNGNNSGSNLLMLNTHNTDAKVKVKKSSETNRVYPLGFLPFFSLWYFTVLYCARISHQEQSFNDIHFASIIRCCWRRKQYILESFFRFDQSLLFNFATGTFRIRSSCSYCCWNWDSDYSTTGKSLTF